MSDAFTRWWFQICISYLTMGLKPPTRSLLVFLNSSVEIKYAHGRKSSQYIIQKYPEIN